LGFRVWGLRTRVEGVRFRVENVGLMVQGEGLESRVWGSGFGSWVWV